MFPETLKDPSVVYLFMTVNAEYLQDGQCCLATNQKRYLPISDSNVYLTSLSINVSAEI